MKQVAPKVECLNPNTGGKMKIDAEVYKLFSKAIYRALKDAKQPLTYTEIVNSVKKSFREQNTRFKGSVEWYAVTVKHDMVANNIIRTWLEKGKRLHQLAS